MLKASTIFLYQNFLKKAYFLKPLASDLEMIVSIMSECFKNGGLLLVCGNGGSAADADHIVGELVKSFRKNRPLDNEIKKAICALEKPEEMLSKILQGGVPAINLTAHSALVSALVNDVGEEAMFAQQVIAYGKPGDVFLGITTSGRSKNILAGGLTAKAIGLKTILLTGEIAAKGEFPYFDLVVGVPAGETADIQDMHSTVYHMLCAMIEEELW